MILACLAGSVTRAEQAPLSKDDVTLLLIGGTTTEKMLELIERRGVDFPIGPDLAKRFHDLGASDPVIEALERASKKRAEAPPAPSPGSSTGDASTPGPPSPAVTSGHAPQTTTGSRQPSPSVEQKIAETLAETESPSHRDENEFPLAPKFRLVDLFGRKLNLADYKGKVVLVDFWATWCGPCRMEIPRFVEFQYQYQDRGFQVIGIAVDDHKWSVKKFYEQYHMNYPVAMGDSELKQIYGATRGLPTTFLIGRDGRIHARYVGAPANLASLEERINSLLGPAPGKASAGVERASNAPPAVPASAPSDTSPSALNVKTVAAVNPAQAQPTPEESKVVASKLPAKATKAVELRDPSPEEVQRIIQEFAAKEKLFKQARDNYTYHQINKVEELGPEGEVVGTYRQDWDILFDDNGKRLEQVTYAPVDTLKGVVITQEDVEAMRNIQPFVLTSDELPEYDVKYLGHVTLDELTTYVFSVRPKEIKKGRQYFKGIVWVDDRDLQIVKSEGKPVPELKTKKGENLFPRFTTYREQIDGKYWFPTYTMADEPLYFATGSVHIKQVIRYTDYKQFKASSTIKVVTELPADKPDTAPKASPPKH